jgi:bacteriocin-like protein
MHEPKKATFRTESAVPELTDEELEQISGGLPGYLSIDGIKGESQESIHKDWIEILSFQHGTTSPK